MHTDAKQCAIPGLDLHKDFVSEEEEKVSPSLSQIKPSIY